MLLVVSPGIYSVSWDMKLRSGTALRTQDALSVKCNLAITSQSTRAGEGVDKRNPLCTAGGAASWCRRRDQQYGGSSNMKHRTTVTQKFHFWVFA